MNYNRFQNSNERDPRIPVRDLACRAKLIFEANPNDIGSTARRLP